MISESNKAMNISQILTKLKSLVYSKSEADTLLSSKASSSHKHTKSEITDFPTIPSKVSQLTNDSGFITGVSWDSVSGKPSTFTPSGHTHTKSQITDFPSLATVATSGSYNDLSNKPSIPSIDLRPQASADANTVSDGVSITHYGSNGPATSLGASTNDGALFQQCWSSAWKVQIAADYRNGNLFTRGKNNGTWQPWRAVAYHGDYVQKSGGNVMTGSLGPSTSGGASLGDSSHKWSTINGVAPGALGLPGSGVNITSLFNSSCQWTAYANGWVMALATYTGSDSIGAFFLKTSDMKISFGDESPTRYVTYTSSYVNMAPRAIFLPVRNGQTVTAIIKALTSTSGPSTKYDRKPTMWFYPCIGNV